jgi:CRP-like cAMP-binding protein
VFLADRVFGGLDRNTQKLIAANMTPLHLLPGHTLCQQGAVADRVWLLQEGAIRASGPLLCCCTTPL